MWHRSLNEDKNFQLKIIQKKYFFNLNEFCSYFKKNCIYFLVGITIVFNCLSVENLWINNAH